MDTLFPILMMPDLAPFRQAFSQPTWPYFHGFIWALLILPGRKTVTRIADACFFVDRHLAGWERFLAQYQWDLNRVLQTLLSLLQRQLGSALQIYGAYLLAVDTFLVAKAAQKMNGVQRWKDSSSNPDRGPYLRGHHWAVGALLSRRRDRWLAWPVLTRLLSGQRRPFCFVVGPEGIRPATLWDGALALVRQVHHQLEAAPLRVVVDAFFSKAPFLAPLMEGEIGVLTRLRHDAVGWDDPPPYPGRGRPAKYGRKWRLAEWVQAFAPRWIPVRLYGKRVRVGVVVREVWLRGLPRKVKVVAVVGSKGRPPVLLLSTDRSLSAVQIIELYGARFTLEIAIRDLKQLGIGDYRSTTGLAIERLVRLVGVAFCLGRLRLLRSPRPHPAGDRAVKEGSLSFGRVRRRLQRVAIRGLLCSKFAAEADWEKVEQVCEPLLQMVN